MSSAKIFVIVTLLALGLPLAPASAAESEQVLVAPFECGTEWQGSTYSGHGQGNLSLDLNRTSLVWPDPLHDLGQPILAQGTGTVVWVANDGWNSGAGAYLEIDYGDVTVSYVHLVDYSIPHEVGDRVSTGDLIGLLGNTGNIFSSTAEKLAHLHLTYKDSRGMPDARGYLLPTQIPVHINGIEYVATPSTDAPPFTSTNCDGYPFFDVPVTSFAREAIALLAELGITEGSGLGQYEPAAQVSREQMAAFLARLWRLLDAGATGLPAELEMPFDDAAGSFAADDIALLAHLGITAVDADGGYSPGDQVSREQMAAFLARLWALLDSESTALPDELTMPFEDASA